MKKLELHSRAYKDLLAQFTRHLQALNYSKDTVYLNSNTIKEYLFWLERNEVLLLESDSKTIKNYFIYLQTRKNERKDGGLSIAYLHKHRNTLKQFYTHLQRLEYYTTSVVLPMLPKAKTFPSVLSIEEIKQLFASCETSLLGKRNRVVLAIYYGLGLRRSEGVNLEITDVDFSKEEVLIRKSKTHRQRLVPMSDFVKNILEDYVYNVREKLIPDDRQTGSFLVTERGKPLSKESVSYVIRKLVETSKIKQKASAHTLRHSIATHLLDQGMSLENIALFLGHTSLDSTQIYTHLTTTTNDNI